MYLCKFRAFISALLPGRLPVSLSLQIQADVDKLPFTVLEGPDGGCLVKVRYCHEDVTFTPEQVRAADRAEAGGWRWEPGSWR